MQWNHTKTRGLPKNIKNFKTGSRLLVLDAVDLVIEPAGRNYWWRVYSYAFCTTDTQALLNWRISTSPRIDTSTAAFCSTMSFARRTAAVVQQCSRKQPRQQSSRRRSDEIENEPPPRQQLSRPSLTTFEDRVTSVTQELVGAYAQRTTQLEAEVSGLRSDLERRKRAEAEVAAERDRLEDLLRRCDADLDEERAAAREALLAVELVEEALRA